MNKTKDKAASLERLGQILSQLECSLKTAEGEKRKELERAIRTTKAVIRAIK